MLRGGYSRPVPRSEHCITKLGIYNVRGTIVALVGY